MTNTSQALDDLIEQFARLPGVGRKTAYRLAFHVLKASEQDARTLADAIVAVKERIQFCSVCFNVTDADPCPICGNPERDQSTICVVEEPHDLLALERVGGYRGVYHVLGGVFSPLDGVGPEDLKIAELVERARNGATEIIIATNPTAEGETTALYIADIVRPLGVKATRIARGLPMGGDVEYADNSTIQRAMEGRTEI